MGPAAQRGGVPGQRVLAGGAAAGPGPAHAHLCARRARAPLPGRRRLTPPSYCYDDVIFFKFSRYLTIS